MLALYLDLEDSNDREKLSEPALFLDQYEDKLVVLDEIHRTPELFQTLRGIIDKGRRKGKRTGRFLILGSASIDLLRQSGESLAGRIEYVDMQPLDITEVGTADNAMNRLWMRGGFPDSYLAKSDRDSFKWRKNFIRTYLERDVAGERVFSQRSACSCAGLQVCRDIGDRSHSILHQHPLSKHGRASTPHDRGAHGPHASTATMTYDPNNEGDLL